MTKYLMLALGLAACGEGGSGNGNGDALVEGTVRATAGASVPASGNVAVLWLNDTGDGDFLFKHGEGTSTGSSFELDVAEPVPAGALFGGQFGMSFIVLVDPSVDVPDGVVDEGALETNMRGFSGQFSLIFKAAELPAAGDWRDDFPAGLTCGKCVDEPEGFDSYTPVACDQVVIDVGDEEAIAVCNAT